MQDILKPAGDWSKTMTRIFTSDYREKRRNRKFPDPFPVECIKRVDRPTTKVNDDEVPRLDEREGGFSKAGRGIYGPQIETEYKRFVPKHPLSGALVAMSGVLADIVDEPEISEEVIDDRNFVPQASSWSPMKPVSAKTAPNTDDPVAMAQNIKEVAYFLRSDVVGICELPPYAVYSHRRPDGEPIKLNHKYAIAILIDQDYRTSEATSGHDWISNSMSFLSYSTSGFIACIIADYIRRLGYPARAHHAMNYQVAVPPILLWAGLGEMCRIGDIVLNPFLGPRLKAAIVTTDLPLTIDKPIDFGLQDFCDKCRKCAQECPSGAITEGRKVMYNGYEKWPVDVEKCTKMRVGNKQGAGCGTCIKVCPWNKPYTPFHRTINWCMRNIPAARRMGIWADDLFGYGKPNYKNKWWLDLELVDDEFHVPKNRE